MTTPRPPRPRRPHEPHRPRRGGLALAAVPLLAGSLGLALATPPTYAAPATADGTRAIRSTQVETGPTGIAAEEPFVVTVRAAGDGALPGFVHLTTPDGRVDVQQPLDGRTSAFTLPPGSYPGLKAAYTGGYDGHLYLPSEATADVTVARATLDHVTDLPAGVVLDQFAPFALGVTSVSSAPHLRPRGHYVLLAFDQDDRRVDLGSGPFDTHSQLAFDTTDLTERPGTYRIYFQTASVDWFEPKDTLLGTVEVVPVRIPTTVGIETPSGETQYGATQVTGRVVPREVTGPVDGTLQAVVDGEATGSPVPVRSTGPVQVPLPTLPPGRYSVKVAYSGGTSYAADESDTGTLVVGRARSATAITTARVARGGLVGIQVGATESAARGSGTVTLREGGRVLGTTTAQQGTGAIRLPADLAPGQHVLTASYDGSETHAASTSLPTTVTVAAPAPVASRVTGTVRRSGRSVTVRATVASGRPVTGRVQVLDGRRVVRTTTLRASSGGRVTATLRNLRPGAHTITVRYLGSPDVKASSRTFRVTVPRR